MPQVSVCIHQWSMFIYQCAQSALEVDLKTNVGVFAGVSSVHQWVVNLRSADFHDITGLWSHGNHLIAFFHSWPVTSYWSVCISVCQNRRPGKAHGLARYMFANPLPRLRFCPHEFRNWAAVTQKVEASGCGLSTTLTMLTLWPLTIHIASGTK